ncbi:protein AIR1/2 [Microdochium nivale]|nr:protein AIR1/2 [Microdochium nivale]
MTQILGLAPTGDVVLSLAPQAANQGLIISTIVAQLRHNVELLSAEGRLPIKTTRAAVRELLRLARIYDEILAKDTTLADLDEGQEDLRSLQLRHACAGLVPGRGEGSQSICDSLSTEVDNSTSEKSSAPITCTSLSGDSSEKTEPSLSAKEAGSVDFEHISTDQVEMHPESSEQSATSEARNWQHSDVHLAMCDSTLAPPGAPAQTDNGEQHKRQPSPPTELPSDASLWKGCVQEEGVRLEGAPAYPRPIKDVPKPQPGQTVATDGQAQFRREVEMLQNEALVVEIAPEPVQPEESVSLHQETSTKQDMSKASTRTITAKQCTHGTHVARNYSTSRRAQVPTRYTSTTDELVVWIYVSSTKRVPPDATEAQTLDPKWWNELFPTIAAVKPNRAWRSTLGHCHLQFANAEDRDAYAKAASQVLDNTGHMVLSYLYQIEIEIDDEVTFDYLKEALKDTESKRRAVRDISSDNNPHQTTKHAIRIFEIDWSNQTKRKKKRTTTCLGTLILTLGSAAAANDIILSGFRCHGTSFAARVHKTNVSLLQCERCGLLGHSRPYCTQDKARCFDCGSDQHVEEGCPSPDPPCCLLCKGGHYADAFNCSVKNQARKSVARTWPPLSQIVQSSEGGPLLFSEAVM